MAHAKPVVIDTRPPTTEETARMLGVSKADVRRIRAMVDTVVAKHVVAKRKVTPGAFATTSGERAADIRKRSRSD
jgi:hypothetical protein